MGRRVPWEASSSREEHRLVQAVFFDFLGTLARFVPEQEVLLSRAAGMHNVLLPPAAAHRGFAAAGAWWQQQLARLPLQVRSEVERRTLYQEFDQLVLRGAGFDLEPGFAEAIFTTMLELGKESRLEVFDDVFPALNALRDLGFTLGVVSNMDASLQVTLESLDLAAFFTVALSSEEAGSTKPDPGIFHTAAARAEVVATDCVYVGDQPDIDVRGALAAGMYPVLVDRAGVHPDPDGATRIPSLANLPDLVTQLPL